MVDSGRAAGTTAVVSIHEEKNKEVEIPRYDPKDKRKLWISKVEIHHNTMMEKIRGLVQQKLVEMVMSDDDFFAGIEDVTVDLDDLDDYGQNEKKPETEEEILLAKKAKILQELLNAIMELPKEEILSFLTSSSLPTGLGKRSSKSPGKQREPTTSAGLDDSNTRISQERQQQQQQEPSNDAYNWILDCGDAWKDLPPVVRVNAIELGYNEVLWDEDVQDLPVFRTFWNKLTSSQRTAATFLGYNEHTWNEDARILVLGGKKPSLSSLTDEEEEPVAPEKSPSAEKSKMDPKEDATVATTLTEMSADRSDNDDDDDDSDSDSDDSDSDSDDEDMFNEFVSNFASEINEEQEANTNAVVKKSQDDDEDAMMDEFLANFGGSAEEEEDSGKETTTKQEVSAKTSSVVPSDEEEEDSEAMMDEFLANFGDSDGVNDGSEKQPSPEKENSTPSTSEEDEEAMMDEFLANFGDSANEDDADSGSGRQSSPEKESSAPTSSGVATSVEDEDEEAMMDEFLANFGDLAEEDDSKNNAENQPSPEKESAVPTSNAISKQEDEDEAMMEEFLTNFVTSNGDEDDSNSNNESIPEKQNLAPPTESLLPKREEEDNDDAAMMEEFVSNFVVSDKKEEEEVGVYTDSGNDHAQSHIPSYDSMLESNIPDDEKYQDEEQPLVFKPKESVMDRGFQGEASPLLPTSTPETQAKNHEALESQKPDEPLSTWETVASYLYWVPVVVGLPVVYMMASGSKPP